MSTLALPTLPSPLPTSTNLSTRRRSSLALPTKISAGSPSPDLYEDDDAEEDDEEEGAKKRVKKKKGGTGGGGGGEVKGEHKYMSEISQMVRDVIFNLLGKCWCWTGMA